MDYIPHTRSTLCTVRTCSTPKIATKQFPELFWIFQKLFGPCFVFCFFQITFIVLYLRRISGRPPILLLLRACCRFICLFVKENQMHQIGLSEIQFNMFVTQPWKPLFWTFSPRPFWPDIQIRNFQYKMVKTKHFLGPTQTFRNVSKLVWTSFASNGWTSRVL